ncbi:MAG: elongation factor Ts [Bacteroidia bacterium]|nr:elongation factor Ts [Bacteroidia bacterium]NND26298.1 elongation factor Ts [Flavobacteriaceae bacterium]MBT8278547.1 elongation factor Ts [Bacteroidia bacterium]NNK59559.1 elongation factor Ts [Flavobacteriaceae bacterium]NNL32476.1 elongation factor Ts [Flavobacteriaceae bacterium]
MVKVTASEVNNLRKATGAGMMDCKNALVEADGNMDKAIEILRKKGQKVAAKRADRDSNEGAVIANVNDNNNTGVIVSLNCETDFVAKNDSFVNLAKQLADIALEHNSLDSLLAADFNGMTVSEKLTEQTGVIGEKIEIGGFKKLEAPFVGSYIHAGNKIATLVGLSANVDNAETVAKDVAMQAAAMNPIALNEDGVDASVVEKEIEIAKDQLRQEGKPEAMLDNIAKGKLKRFFKDNTLVNQAFIKDSKISVADYVKTYGDVSVTAFERVALG